MEPHYVQAGSNNLPEVDFIMVHNFYMDNLDYMSAEMKGSKNVRATRASYGDEAVGYVQLKREGNLCTVKGRITPEHKVRNKTYGVIVVVNEAEGKVTSCKCEDCTAALGGCKHAIAFLYWLLRRSEEPSPTSIECYWKKSTLSKVGTTVKFVKATELKSGGSPAPLANRAAGFLEKVVTKAREAGSSAQILNYFISPSEMKNLSMHYLSIACVDDNMQANAKQFLNYCGNAMNPSVCEEAAKQTSSQSKSSLWYELRYGRITASKIYEAAMCNTTEGSLVERIFGATSLPDTEPMKRGRLLEEKVLNIVSAKYKIKLQRVGLILNNKYPALGASPDAISKDYAIEVKCPSKESTMKNYLKPNGKIVPKFLSQILLQMKFCEKHKGLFCIADFDFEQTKNVNIIEINYDEIFIDAVIEQAMEFWENAIFPVLISTNK